MFYFIKQEFVVTRVFWRITNLPVVVFLLHYFFLESEVTAWNNISCCIPSISKLTGHYGDAVYHQLLYFSQIYLLNWVEDFRVSALELEVSPEDRDSFCVTEDTIPPSALYYLLWCKREERIWLHFRGWIFRAGSEVKHISACKTEHTWQGSRERQ